MTITLVDSNVLLDIATEDPKWLNWSEQALIEAADQGSLAINPIIYAEVSVGFSTVEELDDALPAETFARMQLPYDAAFLAGKAFVNYRRRGGAKVAPLPDFYIGAHAAISGYQLLTRDAARYRTYFPTVTVSAP
ncbi:MAG: type II toxin-antitoxin system VapC family toxin [Micromonosporaceae bacterium]|nr:type II toxin-antitoxin system VapC family toxin [Micromonosporaceae bacterium]